MTKKLEEGCNGLDGSCLSGKKGPIDWLDYEEALQVQEIGEEFINSQIQIREEIRGNSSKIEDDEISKSIESGAQTNTQTSPQLLD